MCKPDKISSMTGMKRKELSSVGIEFGYARIDTDEITFFEELDALEKMGFEPIWATFKTYPHRDYIDSYRTPVRMSYIILKRRQKDSKER
jgi:hypothetical protein